MMPLLTPFSYRPFNGGSFFRGRWGGHRVIDGKMEFARMLKSLMAVMMAAQVNERWLGVLCHIIQLEFGSTVDE